MRVDYSGHYGIGIQIKLIDFSDENIKEEFEELGSIYNVLYECLNEKYDWFEVGQGSYTGEDNEFYVEILKPFEYGLDLQIVKIDLLAHLQKIGLETIGEFGVIGGLEIY